jgi:hypothetical protein
VTLVLHLLSSVSTRDFILERKLKNSGSVLFPCSTSHKRIVITAASLRETITRVELCVFGHLHWGDYKCQACGVLLGVF